MANQQLSWKQKHLISIAVALMFWLIVLALGGVAYLIKQLLGIIAALSFVLIVITYVSVLASFDKKKDDNGREST